MQKPDVMQEQVVPELYSRENPRILSPDAEVDYQGGKVRVVRIGEDLSVVVMQPDGITYEDAQGILLGISGYTMPPTSIMGDSFTIPLMAKLKETDSMAVFFAPYGRGSEKPRTDQGRWTAGKIRRYTAMEAKRILEHFDPQKDKKKWLAGHSLGAQTAGFMLADPEKYGFSKQDFDGALLYCPAPLAHSQLLLTRDSGKYGFNDAFIRLIPGSIGRILEAILTGKGLRCDDEKVGKELFFDNIDFKGVQEILERMSPDSGLYFLQALTMGTGNIKQESLRGKRVGLMGGAEDTMVTDVCMEATHTALMVAGAVLKHVEDACGGHFSPFLMDPSLSGVEDVQDIQAKHRVLLDHIMQ